MDSALCPIEACEVAALVQDLMARKPIRISVPESLTGFLRMTHIDWSREVEIPPPDAAAANVPDFDRLVLGMAELKGRFQGLQTLVYLQQGRIFYTMLGGTRYAARVEWSAPSAPPHPSRSPLLRPGINPAVARQDRVHLGDS